MLQYSHEYKENRIKTRDGKFGKISDFIICNDTWIIEYLVIEVGSWLFNHNILLSTDHLKLQEGEDYPLSTMLTMDQLKNNPQWTGDKPFTDRKRTFFSQLPVYPAYSSVGFPWLFSSISLKPINDIGVTAMEDQANIEEDDQQLQSINEVLTYRIAACDKVIGVVKDFLVEDKPWAVPYLIVSVGTDCRKNVLLNSKTITGVSEIKSLITSKVSPKQLEACPEFAPDKTIEEVS